MYYLPLYVNESRMHVTHLRAKIGFQKITLPTFIVVNSNDYTLVSLPSENPKMICDDEDNIDLHEVDFELSKAKADILPEKYRNLPCYMMEIKANGAGRSTIKDVDGIYFDGSIGGNPATSQEWRITVTTNVKDSEYILLIKYVRQNQRATIEYYDAIRILTVRDEGTEVCSASLDFGSEASQVYFKGDPINLNVKDAFCDITNSSKQQDYYQGRHNDANPGLFKSIYHIHTSPGKTNMGDLPMNNGEKTFVQTLLPVNYQNNGELALLPNLKLIELLNFDINNTPIDFSQGVDDRISPIANPALGVRAVQDGILRMILSNFLAVILYYRRPNNTAQKICLRFTLLVPNVYYQKKVAKLIDDLYTDFDLLVEKNSDLYSGWRGIEVKILSESDASYFGIRLANQADGYKRNAYSLVIDAGKGTTDFSLLNQQGACLSNFACVYRSGIPASGHVLTYAVFEALENYFASLGLRNIFINIIKDAQQGNRTANLIHLVDLLEEQKIKIEQFNNIVDAEIENTARNSINISDLIGMLTDMNSKKIGIPHLKEFVEEKINLMIQMIADSVFTYAKKRNIKLFNVFLTGRAFELKLFREAVIKTMIDDGLITNANQVVFQPLLAKSACVKGAVQGRSFIVNNKSIMLGTPSIVENVGETSRFIQMLRHFFGRDKIKMAIVDNDFFYEGIGKGGVSNMTVDICGRAYAVNFDTSEDTSLYFLGDGYLVKHGNKNEFIEENSDFTTMTNVETSKDLAEQSLFPFYIKIEAEQSQEEHVGEGADVNITSIKPVISQIGETRKSSIDD